MSHPSHDVRVHEDLASLSEEVAAMFANLARDSIAGSGAFNVVLAGGSTPRRLYELLATRDDIEWSRVQLFWGDDRCVTPDHPDSNYRMVREALIDHVAIPEDRVHRIPTELEPEFAARCYDGVVQTALAGCEEQRFDLVLLGMGADGHTASLFPDTPALDEPSKWVVANSVPQHDMTRVTMTANALNTGRHIWFLVCGEDKSFTLREVLEGAYAPHCHPSQLIQPSSGELVWHVDAHAARNLALSPQETA